MKRIVAIIQARMGSSRLPGKVMMNVGDRTVLAHLVERLKSVSTIHQVVVATTMNSRDSEIVDHCRELRTAVYRGSEEDVLGRYVEAARQFHADIVFRATSDEPYKDPEVIQQVLDAHLESRVDYTCNNLIPTFPNGSTVEIVNFPVLEKTARVGKHPADREHVTFYMRNRPSEFRICNVEAQGRLRRPELRYCLDTQEDLRVVKAIFDHLGSKKPYFTMRQIINFLDNNETVKAMNRNVRPKEVSYS
jgi:spore coat polysaccharide biosynthesis protein SpsF